MTTFLTPVEIGKASLLTTGTAFFTLFLVSPVGAFINRRLHAWIANGFFRHYFHLYCIYLVGVACAASTLTWLVLRNELGDLGLPATWFAALIAGSLIFNTINQTLVPSMNMLQWTRPFVYFTIGTLSIGLIISLVLIKLFAPNAVAWLSGPILSQLIFSLLAYKVFFRGKSNKSRVLEDTDYRRLFSFAWPISLSVGLNWLHMQGYRFVLADQFGLADLGLFSAGYALASSLTTACDSVITTWFLPRFYQEANSSDVLVREQAWGRYASSMLPFTILASSGIFMTAPYLTVIMLGPAYQTTVTYVMVGALAEWGRIFFNVFALNYHGKMDTKKLITPSLIGAGTACALMIIPIRMQMIAGVPLALLIGAVAGIVIIRRQSTKKLVEEGIDWRSLILVIVGVVGVSLIFEIFRLSLFPVFGRFEPYAALLIALSLWCGIAWTFLHLRKLET